MKFSLLSFVALPALFTSAIAAPVTDQALEKRQLSSAYSIVSSLASNIQQYIGNINSTAATISSGSSASDNATAAASYISDIEAITALVDTAKTSVDALKASSKVRRQTDAALAALVEDLLLDISGALNNIVGTLGLGSLLGSLNPLVSSLSGLLLSLETVVDNLLALVKQLLDGLLTGLSVGLAGLNL